MNIAYQGYFLKEGLISLGHNIFDLSLKPGDDINIMLDKFKKEIDFVLLELWGAFTFPVHIAKCAHKLIAYCIDSPINEFWAADYCKSFDHVFVDQQSSVKFFEARGVKATWLPLCAQSSYFANFFEKEHDLSFVGTINSNRIKRQNLISFIKKRYGMSTFFGKSFEETKNIFSKSKITLNENLFPGLTLRVFQALAAGTVVLTEGGDKNETALFRHGEHLIYYDHVNIGNAIEKILSSPAAAREIAAHGQEVCHSFHTSQRRAAELLAALEDARQCLSPDEKGWGQTQSRHRHAMRYGGNLTGIIQEYRDFAEKGIHVAEAITELGDIAARRGDRAKARELYRMGGELNNSPWPWVKLAILEAKDGNFAQGRQALDRAGRVFSQEEHACGQQQPIGDALTDILFQAGRLYFMGDLRFDMGFQKNFIDPAPSTAFEMYEDAWKIRPHPAIMDSMLECLAAYGLEGELLPFLLDGIRLGALSDIQILRAADIAAHYYDEETANVIISAYRRAI